MQTCKRRKRETPHYGYLVFSRLRKGPEWEPIGVAWLDTTRAVCVSNVLAEGAKPLGKVNKRKWLGAWCAGDF